MIDIVIDYWLSIIIIDITVMYSTLMLFDVIVIPSPLHSDLVMPDDLTVGHSGRYPSWLFIAVDGPLMTGIDDLIR